MRTPPGLILATTEGTNRWELVLGTHGRSGEQWDICKPFSALVGPDGYPAEIWNQRTGVINHEVAAYWLEDYDLTAIMQRNWKTLGPKLQGKLHVTVGTADTYYLDGAVHLMQNTPSTPQAIPTPTPPSTTASTNPTATPALPAAPPAKAA